MRKKKIITLEEWLNKRLKSGFVQHMRRMFFYSPLRAESLKRAKAKNGLYKCAITKKLFPINLVTVDHKDPVVDPKVGWVDYNTFMQRLFCAVENLQVISKVEHSKKTAKERALRNGQKNTTKK